MDWKAGDWVVFELRIGQIKELRAGGDASFSDGFCETSGRLADRFRPLTLRNKRIAEAFDIYYERLRECGGNTRFNFPDIVSYFARLALEAIDGDEAAERAAYDKGNAVLQAARDYTPIIDGIRLFRAKLEPIS